MPSKSGKNKTLAKWAYMKVDRSLNEDKFYTIYIDETPSGNLQVIVNYGRNGTAGAWRVKLDDEPIADHAEKNAAKLCAARAKKGYLLCQSFNNLRKEASKLDQAEPIDNKRQITKTEAAALLATGEWMAQPIIDGPIYSLRRSGKDAAATAIHLAGPVADIAHTEAACSAMERLAKIADHNMQLAGSFSPMGVFLAFDIFLPLRMSEETVKLERANTLPILRTYIDWTATAHIIKPLLLIDAAEIDRANSGGFSVLLTRKDHSVLAKHAFLMVLPDSDVVADSTYYDLPQTKTYAF